MSAGKTAPGTEGEERHRPKKRLGQNFLMDGRVLSRIVAAVELSGSDQVLEIGPGRGALTALLADSAAKVVAIELDRQLVELLGAKFAGCKNVEIVPGDILAVDLGEVLHSHGEGPWKVAANLPYNISSQVLFRILDCRQLFSLLILMFQKEVGDRLVAFPGSKEYGILSVFCKLHFDVARILHVRPGSFFPVPKVDSVVLRFVPLPAPRVDVGDEQLFRRVVKAAFGQRRKTLWNCLRSAAFLDDAGRLQEVLERCRIDGGRRGETLTLDEFAVLTRGILAEIS